MLPAALLPSTPCWIHVHDNYKASIAWLRQALKSFPELPERLYLTWSGSVLDRCSRRGRYHCQRHAACLFINSSEHVHPSLRKTRNDRHPHNSLPENCEEHRSPLDSMSNFLLGAVRTRIRSKTNQRHQIKPTANRRLCHLSCALQVDAII